MEIGLGNQMSTVIAHRLLGVYRIDTDGNPDNNTTPLEMEGNGGLLNHLCAMLSSCAGRSGLLHMPARVKA